MSKLRNSFPETPLMHWNSYSYDRAVRRVSLASIDFFFKKNNNIEFLGHSVAAMASGDRKVEKELTRRVYRTKLEGESREDLQSLAKQYSRLYAETVNRVAAMALGDRKVEKELTRCEYRTKLEGESREDLQSLAKQYFIPANLKSKEIIDDILYMEYDNGSPRLHPDVTYQTCIETMQAMRSLMKRISEKSSIESGARCIFDCVAKVEAEMNAFAVKPAAQGINKVPSGKEAIPSMSSCATAVKAVPVIVAKPDTNKPVGVKSEPAVVNAVQQVIGVESIKPATKPVDVKLVVPAVVESKLDSEAAGFTSIFLGVSMTVTDDQLQAILGVNAKIGRRRRNRLKVRVPDDDVGRVLKLESVSGHKLRVEKWRSFKAPSYHTNRHGRQAIKEDVTTTVKERARFAAEFLNAQTRPEGQRLYSQVVSNKVEARMKSMETAMYDVKQVLKRMSSREASTRATANPAAIHGGERV